MTIMKWKTECGPYLLARLDCLALLGVPVCFFSVDAVLRFGFSHSLLCLQALGLVLFDVAPEHKQLLLDGLCGFVSLDFSWLVSQAVNCLQRVLEPPAIDQPTSRLGEDVQAEGEEEGRDGGGAHLRGIRTIG